MKKQNLLHQPLMGAGTIITLLLLTMVTPLFAQQPKFPAWMDEVKFSDPSPSESNAFSEPQGPVDPATGQSTTTSAPKNSIYGKPKLPDFSKMREKALKAELEKKNVASDTLEQSFNASLKNTEQLQKNKEQLEQLLAANPGENERHQLLKALGELTGKIALSNELINILGSEIATAPKAVASLSNDQFNRAQEIHKLLFPGPDKKNSAITPPKSLFPEHTPLKKQGTDKEEEETDEEFDPPPRVYRPGQIKSFYHESKKAKQQLQEEDSDE